MLYIYEVFKLWRILLNLVDLKNESVELIVENYFPASIVHIKNVSMWQFVSFIKRHLLQCLAMVHLYFANPF